MRKKKRLKSLKSKVRSKDFTIPCVLLDCALRKRLTRENIKKIPTFWPMWDDLLSKRRRQGKTLRWRLLYGKERLQRRKTFKNQEKMRIERRNEKERSEKNCILYGECCKK